MTMPLYPQRYPSQPFTGKLPLQVGPPDALYSSGTAPYYQSQIDRAHGRTLAGVNADVQDENAEPGYALNELRVMAEMDDVQANGIFDPPSSSPNIYPDAGILATRASIPGYLARERLYAPSEVRDVTTGRPVIYVNSGAVSMDSAAQVAFIERGEYAPPEPIIGASRAGRLPSRSITNVRVNAQPIGQLDTGLGTWGTLGLLALVGLAAGGAWAAFGKGKR
jgi:hypothetical protein